MLNKPIIFDSLYITKFNDTQYAIGKANAASIGKTEVLVLIACPNQGISCRMKITSKNAIWV